jgi:protein-disulfide isomerase
METKKTVRVILIFIIATLVVFSLILFFNNHLEEKGQSLTPVENSLEIAGGHQSYVAVNMPIINDDDCLSGHGDDLDIIVYEDCGDIFSADFYDSLEQARLDFGDKIRIAYRPFNFNHTDLSSAAAVAVRCAFDQGKGDDFRGKLFQAVRANQFNHDKLSALAGEIGLNQEDFQECLTNPQKKEKIEKMFLAAANFSVYGAPTVFIGEEMIVGARPYNNFTDSNGDEIEGLKQVIARQLK